MGGCVVGTGATAILYWADRAAGTIRKIDIAGNSVATVAGKATSAGCADGTGGTTGTARFDQPHNCALGPDGNLYVADQTSGLVRKVTLPGGVVTTLGGQCQGFQSVDGCGTNAIFGQLGQLTVDSSGNIWAGDRSGAGSAKARVIKGTPGGSTTVTIHFTGSASDQASNFTLQSSGTIIPASSYADVSASITGPLGGPFQATIAPSGPAQFYRIKRTPSAINGHLQYFSYFGNNWQETKDHINVVWDVGDVDGDVPQFEALGLKYVLNIWWFGNADREEALQGAKWDAWYNKVKPHINYIAAFNLADEPNLGNRDYFERQIQKLKSVFPNTPTMIEYTIGFAELPSGLDWLLIEFYGMSAAQAAQQFNNAIKPELSANQKIVAAPSSDTYGTDGENAQNAANFFDWSKSEPMVVGIVPWYWDYWGNQGVKVQPSTRAKYTEIGIAITRN